MQFGNWQPYSATVRIITHLRIFLLSPYSNTTHFACVLLQLGMEDGDAIDCFMEQIGGQHKAQRGGWHTNE